MNPAELKEAFEALQKGFVAFKAANDDRIKQIEAKGFADPLTEEKVNKASDEVGALDTRLKQIEAYLQRPGVDTPSNDNDDEIKVAADWLTAVKERPFAKTDVNMAEIAEYGGALDAYLRKGLERMGDADRQKVEEYKDLSVAVNTEGGYWVTPERSNRLARRMTSTAAASMR